MFRITVSGKSSAQFDNVERPLTVPMSKFKDRIVDDSQYHPTTEFSQMDTNGTVGDGAFDYSTVEEVENAFSPDGFDLTDLHNNHYDINELNQIRKAIMQKIEYEVDSAKKEELTKQVEEMGIDVTHHSSVDGDSNLSEVQGVE